MSIINRVVAVGIAVMLCAATKASAAEAGDDPVPGGAPGVTLSRIEVNGITMRIAEAGEGPLVLLLHGFPESWYSWRHQIRALSAAGYRVVAPDMRGYGGTDAPAAIDAYDALDLSGDVTGLLDALGEKQAILIGHDWGAAVAWYCALLAPGRWSALITMSVPWGPRSDTPPLDRLRRSFGDNFFYMLYFQEPGVAEAELDPDPRAVLTRFLASPGAPRDAPAISDPKASAGGLLGRFGVPKQRPIWLTGEDLDYYVAEFTRTGFRGGLNYYRNLDRSWELTPQLKDATIEVPTMFIAGEKDLVIRGRDRESLESSMLQVAPRLTLHLIPEAGHWIQQERADEVNGMILDFLGGRSATGSSSMHPAGGATGEEAGARGVQTGGGHRTSGFGSRNPHAPVETAQFDFIVGSWNCTTKFMKPDASGYAEGKARWIGYYILDGWAIQDDWIGVRPDGGESHGTNVRSFNPRTGTWDNRWLAAGSLEFKYFESEQVGDTMVMIGGEGKDGRGAFIDRNVFHDITADHWSWRKDRSYDGGETWIEGIGFIEATRVKP